MFKVHIEYPMADHPTNLHQSFFPKKKGAFYDTGASSHSFL